MTLYEFYINAYTFYKESGKLLGYAMIVALDTHRPKLLELCKVQGYYPIYAQSIHDEDLKKFFQFIEKNWHNTETATLKQSETAAGALIVSDAVKVISPLLCGIAEFFHEQPENLSIDPIDMNMICVSYKTLPGNVKNYNSEDFTRFCKKNNFGGFIWFNEDNTITFSIQLGQV